MSEFRYVFFDIETAPNPLADSIISEMKFKPRANIKDPEKIKADIEEKRRKEYEKAALSGVLGRVTTIVAKKPDGEPKVFCNKEEKKTLIEFGNFLVEDGADYRLVAKNIEFDRPFLIRRYISKGLGVPRALRPIDISRIDDTDKIFSLSRACSQLTTLQNDALGLGIKGKHMNSANAPQLFFDWFLNGNQKAKKDLVEHCIQDVLITEEIYERAKKDFTFVKNLAESEIPF